MKNKRITIIKLLLYTLIITTMIGYLGYTIYTISKGINIYFSYNHYEIDYPIICNIIRYLKEVIVILLICLMLKDIFTNKQTLFYTFVYFFIIILGTIILLCNKIFNIYIIILGIRCFIYLYAILMCCLLNDKYNFNFKIIYYIVTIGNIINFVSVVSQIITSIGYNISYIGEDGHRYVGLYGGSNALGASALSFIMFFIIAKNKKVIKSKLLFAINIIISMIICIASGTRSSMICCLILLFFYLFEITKIPNRRKIIYLLISGIILFPLFVSISSQIANRGSILEVQLESGRIKILIEMLKNSTFTELVFGRGIGVATNAYYLISNGDTEILDGTFNLILYQYGFLGIAISIIAGIKLLYYMFKDPEKIYLKLSLGIIIIIQIFTGNIFELYTFIILLCLSIFLLVEKNNIIEERKKEDE